MTRLRAGGVQRRRTTEDMLALGLESRMDGDVRGRPATARRQPVPTGTCRLPPVRDVSPDYFTQEELVGLRPDFLFAGWDYGLAGTLLTPQSLAKYGIKTLVLTDSCAHVAAGQATSVSIDDTYQDLRNLGEIFNVRDARRAGDRPDAGPGRGRAGQGRRAQAGHGVRLRQRRAAPFTGAGLAMPTALISLGGGTNIFASLKQS